jgi:glutathione synthase/RimK-type ligase-like ATP-grasp enzyme
VAKWGNWRCGENKERFAGRWRATEPTLFEPLIAGDAVRIVILGHESRQIRLAGTDWRKSVHGVGAAFMTPDPELIADTQAIQRGFGLDIIGTDYLVSGPMRYLLEVNHIPSVTCFPELWRQYVDVVAAWCRQEATA